MSKKTSTLSVLFGLMASGAAAAAPVDFVATGIVTDDVFPGESFGSLANYIGGNFTFELSVELDTANASWVELEETAVQYVYEGAPYHSKLTFTDSAGAATVFTEVSGVFTFYENDVDLTGIEFDGTTLSGNYDIVEVGVFSEWPIESEAEIILVGPSDWLQFDSEGHIQAGFQPDLSAALFTLGQASIQEIDQFGSTVEELAFVRLLPDAFAAVPEPNVQFVKLGDLNADGVEEVGQFGLRTNNDKPQLMVTDPVSGATVAAYTWNASWDQVQLQFLADMTGDGVGEIGLFGFAKADGRPQLTVKDGANPGTTVNTFSWPANWEQVKFVELDDSSADGVNEMAIFGFESNGQAKLVIRSGADPEVQLPTYSWPALWSNVQFKTVGDINSDGVNEVAIFGTRTSNDKSQLIVKDGADASVQYPPYNWGDNWDDVELLVLDDLSGDSIDDVALFGVRKSDGRAQAVVKNGVNRALGVRNYGWPAELTDPTFIAIPDRTGDGIDELGIVGTRSDNGRTQLIVKRGNNQSTLEAVGWNTTWVDGQVQVLPDLSGDGVADYGLLGNHASAGYAQLVVIDSGTGSPLRTFSWPGFDAADSTFVTLGDMNDDGIGEVGLYAFTAAGGQLIIRNGANQAQTLGTINWPNAWY